MTKFQNKSFSIATANVKGACFLACGNRDIKCEVCRKIHGVGWTHYIPISENPREGKR